MGEIQVPPVKSLLLIVPEPIAFAAQGLQESWGLVVAGLFGGRPQQHVHQARKYLFDVGGRQIRESGRRRGERAETVPAYSWVGVAFDVDMNDRHPRAYCAAHHIGCDAASVGLAAVIEDEED